MFTRLSHFLGEELVPPSVLSFADLLEADALERKRRVLALPAHERHRALRFLAARDHPSLVGVPMDSATIDRLYPYLAVSRRRTARLRRCYCRLTSMVRNDAPTPTRCETRGLMPSSRWVAIC